MFNSKVITKHEDSRKSPPCKSQSDYTYDDCVYGLKQRKMVEMFNCTFALFANKFYPPNNEVFEECTFRNTSKHNVDSFLNFISNNNGKGIWTENV